MISINETTKSHFGKAASVILTVEQAFQSGELSSSEVVIQLINNITDSRINLMRVMDGLYKSIIEENPSAPLVWMMYSEFLEKDCQNISKSLAAAEQGIYLLASRNKSLLSLSRQYISLCIKTDKYTLALEELSRISKILDIDKEVKGYLNEVIVWPTNGPDLPEEFR